MISRYIAPIGLVLLALSIACSPITRTSLVHSDQSSQPSEAVQHQFVVNIPPGIFVSDEELNTQLELLFENQHLSIDMADVIVDAELGEITFNFDIDSDISEIPAEVLSMVVSGLTGMSTAANPGLLLATSATPSMVLQAVSRLQILEIPQ